MEAPRKTLLAVLVAERHWTREDLCAQFERASREVLGESRPLSRRQAERWLAGDITRLPHPGSCRVLESIFQCKIGELFGEQKELTTSKVSPTTSLMSSPDAVEVFAPNVSYTDADRYAIFLNRVFNEYVLADFMLGPSSVLSIVSEHLRQISKFMSRGPVSNSFYRSAARYAEFASWLYQDLGNISAALPWINRAQKWAEITNDPLLVSYILVRKASQIMEGGHSELAVLLSSRASAGDLTFRARALANQQEAHAHAALGDERSCLDRIESAKELVSLSDRRNEEGPGRYCVPAYIEMQQATCWLRLDRPHLALQVFAGGLRDLPDVHHRDKGVYLATYAQALIAADKPDEAVDAAR